MSSRTGNDQIGSYRILKTLGEGGMGTVYLAEDVQLHRKVALKVMQEHFAKSPGAKDRFLREARAMAAVKSDHIVNIFHVGEDQGCPYFVMELLEGATLEELLQSNRLMSWKQIIQLASQIALGLAEAHEQGLIHRDIKPSNIFVELPKRRVKILDFGIARISRESMHLTQTGAVMGTVHYMAPEQTTGQPITSQADLFSFGVVLYQMCTGRLPFQGDNHFQIMEAVRFQQPISLGDIDQESPMALSQLIDWLMEKDPNRRPANAREVYHQLEAIESPLGNSTKIMGTNQSRETSTLQKTYRELPPSQKRSNGWIYVVVAGLLLVAGVWIWAISVKNSRKEDPPKDDKEIVQKKNDSSATIPKDDPKKDKVNIQDNKVDPVKDKVDPGKNKIDSANNKVEPIKKKAEQKLLLTVSKDGKGDYKSISEAIEKVAPGGLIRIKPGKYEENVYLWKEVELQGDGPRNEIVIESKDGSCIEMATTKAKVRGLTIHGKTGTNKLELFAISIPKGELFLDNCDITNDSLSCIGIKNKGTNPTIFNCRIQSSKECGIFVLAGAKATITECDISGTERAGINTITGGDPTVRKCRIHDCKSVGVLVCQEGLGTFEDCEISSNLLHNLEVREKGRATFKKCDIHSSKDSGIILKGDGYANIENCKVHQNGYTGILVRDKCDPIIRGCDIYDNGNGGGVLVTDSGLGTFQNCQIYGNQYSCVMVMKQGDPIVRGCKIKASKEGSGVFVYDNGKGTFEDCDIVENKLSGVSVRSGGDPSFRDCRINKNGGVGIYVFEKGFGTYEGNDLTNNVGKSWDIREESKVNQKNNKE